MLYEILAFFKQKKLTVFFDGTVGAAGHAEALLSDHPEIELYIGVDRDEEALHIAKNRLQPWIDKVWLVHEKFSNIVSILQRKNIKNVDGILLDVGVSSMQLDQKEKGFSFQKEGPLDMRMGLSEMTAATLVNNFPEKELENIFWLYGEERRSKMIARLIVEERKKKKFHTTIQLAEFIEKRIKRFGRIHPATKIFQALRIFVNNELEELTKGLQEGFFVLNPQTLLAAISFHSLEDRIVKKSFQNFKKEHVGKILTKKPLQATRKEQIANPRARSAKLRVIEKL